MRKGTAPPKEGALVRLLGYDHEHELVTSLKVHGKKNKSVTECCYMGNQFF